VKLLAKPGDDSERGVLTPARRRWRIELDRTVKWLVDPIVSRF
jgi:hypothetical protein